MREVCICGFYHFLYSTFITSASQFLPCVVVHS